MTLARRVALLLGSFLMIAAAPLDSYRWQDRILLVFAPDAASPELATQRAIGREQAAGFTERDLRTVEVVDDAVTGASDPADALRRRFGARDAFRVVLLDKDGNVKLDAAAPLPADRLFATIDAMPMRRSEAKRR